MDFNPVLNSIDFDIKEFKEKVNNLPDDATIQDILDILGMDDHQNKNWTFENEPPMNMPNNGPFEDRRMGDDNRPNN